jgi:hypothetical protein
LAAVVPDEASERDEQRTVPSSAGKLSTLQPRFEQSRAGKVVISVLVGAFVLVGVVWNIPDSPIGRGLQAVVKPVAAATGLNQNWGMYGTPDERVETVEVHVEMANGETRIWTMQPGGRGVGWWDRWILLRRAVIHDSNVRPELAHWVVRQVTGPTEHAIAVSVVLRTENLSPPGEPAGGKSPASKVLYQESLAGAQ